MKTSYDLEEQFGVVWTEYLKSREQGRLLNWLENCNNKDSSLCAVFVKDIYDKAPELRSSLNTFVQEKYLLPIKL